MKLSVWAKDVAGISYSTAYRLYRRGQLPVPSYQLPTGTIIVEAEPSLESRLMKENEKLRIEVAKLKAKKSD